MNILSLFDGMSCGRVACERAGIPVTNYYASEIDKHAIKVAQSNYPTTVQFGDVRVVRQMVDSGVIGHIDLLIAGSPCQGFSLAGKQLAFNDPRSVLFFEYVHILNALRKRNPNIKFLLENVSMKKEFLEIISSFLGVEPIKINSTLVSAQNRVRYYWCNWKVEQPTDRGIFLKDILDETFTEDELCDVGQMNRLLNSTDVAKAFSKIDPAKAGAMTARQYANWKGTFVTVTGGRVQGRRVDPITGRRADGSDIPTKQRIEIREDGKANCMTTVEKDSIVVRQRPRGNNPGFVKPMDKSPTITSNNWQHNVSITEDEVSYRKLSPIECERLQTLPDNYTAAASNSQRYKMLGNGWTVEVIAHILRGMPRHV